MINPQLNGHQQAHEQEPAAPHPEAIRQALLARNDALRTAVKNAEGECDYINALLITEQQKSMSLIAENARLANENAALKAQTLGEEGVAVDTTTPGDASEAN